MWREKTVLCFGVPVKVRIRAWCVNLSRDKMSQQEKRRKELDTAGFVVPLGAEERTR